MTFPATIRPIMCVCLGAASLAWGADADPPARRIGIHGGNEVLWLYDHHPREEGGHHLSFALRTIEQKIFVGPGNLRFLSKAIVRSAAVVDDDLHVFYDNDHRRYAVVQQRLRQYTEQPLQDTPVPLAVAGDPRGTALYAVVSCATARATLERHRETLLARRELRADADDAEPLPALPPLAPELATCEFVLLEYSGGAWSMVTPLPEDVQGVARLIVDGAGRVHLFDVADSGLRQIIWDADSWQAGPPVPTSPLALIDVVRDARHIGVVEQDGTALYVRWFEDDTWGERLALQGAETGSAMTAALFDEAVHLAALVNDQVSTGTWSEDGASTEPWSEVLALRMPVASHPRLRSFAAFGAMALLLGFVFWRRHDSVMLEIELPAAYRVAGFGRRLLSFLVDFSLACVITLPFAWYQPLLDWTRQYAPLQLEATQPLVLSKGIIASWFVVCTAHVLVCIASEALYGTTPGKWLVGCRVLGEHGGRPRFGQILTRNILRYVELFPVFEWLPPLVLILFTRNRQRLGDLVARTVIVEHIAPDRSRMTPSTSDHEDADPPA